MISVAAVYFFINISYYALVSKTDILESQRIVASVIKIRRTCLSFHSFFFFILNFFFYRALYFRNLFGPTTERVSFSSYEYGILSFVDGRFVPTHHYYFRPLAPSLHYPLWETYYLASFLMAEVIKSI